MPGERLTGDAVCINAEQVREVGGEGDDAQLLVGRPLVASAARVGFGRAAEDCCQTRPGGRPLGPIFERECNVLALRRCADPQVDVVVNGRGKGGTRDSRAELAGKLSDGSDLGQRQRLA